MTTLIRLHPENLSRPVAFEAAIPIRTGCASFIQATGVVPMPDTQVVYTEANRVDVFARHGCLQFGVGPYTTYAKGVLHNAK